MKAHEGSRKGKFAATRFVGGAGKFNKRGAKTHKSKEKK